MKAAFSAISKQEEIKVKFNQNITKKQLFASQHLDRDFYLDMFEYVTNGSPTKGYKQRMKNIMSGSQTPELQGDKNRVLVQFN